MVVKKKAPLLYYNPSLSVCNRLEKLRKSSYRHSTVPTDQISLARNRALAQKRRTTYTRTMPKHDSCSSIGGYRLRTNAFKDDICLIPPEDSEKANKEAAFDHGTEGILDHKLSSSSDSDDSPPLVRKALKRRYLSLPGSCTEKESRDSTGVRNNTTSVSEINITEVSATKEQEEVQPNFVRLLSRTDSGSDAGSSSPGEPPRRILPRVSISHVDIQLKDTNDSTFNKVSPSEMSLGLLSPINHMIMPSRSLEGLCNSLAIEDDNDEDHSGLVFKFDKKSVSMQSLVSLSSSSGASTSSSANPSTTSLLSPARVLDNISSSFDVEDGMNATCPLSPTIQLDTSNDQTCSTTTTNMNESGRQSPTRQLNSPNDQANSDQASGPLSPSSGECDDLSVCSIDDRRLSTPRCSIEMEGPRFLRPRRDGSMVQQMAQTTSPKLSNSTDLLNKYQFLSLGCCEGLKDRPDLRDLLTECPHNTEGQNYKLSYEREA